MFSIFASTICILCGCLSVRRGDVRSAWCGIRPLVSDPNKKDTQSVARNHIIEVAEDHLITIAGKTCFLYDKHQFLADFLFFSVENLT